MVLGDYKRFQGRQVGFLKMIWDDLRIARVVGGRMLDAQETRIYLLVAGAHERIGVAARLETVLLVKLLGRLVGAAAGLVVDEEGGSVPVVGEAVDLAFKEEVPYRHSEGHFGASVLESGKTGGLVAAEPANERRAQAYLLLLRQALLLNLRPDSCLAGSEERSPLAPLDGLLRQTMERRAKSRGGFLRPKDACRGTVRFTLP